MQISISDLKSNVLLLDGKPQMVINSPEQRQAAPMRVIDAFRNALNAIFQDEENPQNGKTLSFEKKMQRYEISKRLWSSLDNEDGNVELTIEEAAELKSVVSKMYAGEVLGFLVSIIEKK